MDSDFFYAGLALTENPTTKCFNNNHKTTNRTLRRTRIPVDVCDFGNVVGIAVFDVLGMERGIVRVVSRFLLWFLALNVGCIAAIIAGASLVAQMIGRLLRSAALDGSGNTAKRDKGL